MKKNFIEKQLELVNNATFTISKINGTECYKELKGRYYRCFVNSDAGMNEGIKYYRISKDEYEAEKREYELLNSMN